MAVQRKPRTGKVIGRKVVDSVPSTDTFISAKDDARIKELMVACAEHNELMNNHKKTYEAARAELLTKLNELGKETYTHSTATVNGTDVFLEASIGARSQRVIDPKKLHSLVGLDVFLRCVSAAVGAVEGEAGKAIANKCSEMKSGEPNVTVKSRART